MHCSAYHLSQRTYCWQHWLLKNTSSYYDSSPWLALTFPTHALLTGTRFYFLNGKKSQCLWNIWWPSMHKFNVFCLIALILDDFGHSIADQQQQDHWPARCGIAMALEKISRILPQDQLLPMSNHNLTTLCLFPLHLPLPILDDFGCVIADQQQQDHWPARYITMTLEKNSLILPQNQVLPLSN